MNPDKQIFVICVTSFVALFLENQKARSVSGRKNHTNIFVICVTSLVALFLEN
jgi:hypothetical protein